MTDDILYVRFSRLAHIPLHFNKNVKISTLNKKLYIDYSQFHNCFLYIFLENSEITYDRARGQI